MSQLIAHIRKIDWRKGIISKEEAERFVNRFAKVLLQQAIANKETEKGLKTQNESSYN